MTTKNPWIKFYSSDWRSELSLLTTSLAARGLWIEMLCIMNDSEPKGSLAKRGKPYTSSDLAVAVRAPTKDVERLLAELEAEDVFSRDPDGTIFSRRIRRDVAKAERDKANGRTGGNPRLKVVHNG